MTGSCLSSCLLERIVAKQLVSLFLLFLFYFIFLKDFIYLFIFRERGREGEIRKHQCVVASHTPPTGDLARNPGMCPD